MLCITNQCPGCEKDIETFLTENYCDYPRENFRSECPFCNIIIEIDVDLNFNVTSPQLPLFKEKG